MDTADPWFTTLYIIATISIFCTVLVLIHLTCFTRRKEIRIRLLWLLHFTLLLEDISNIPVIYRDPHGLCQFIAWLRFYSAMSNVLAIFFMVLYYFGFVVVEKHSPKINRFINKYATGIIILFPFIITLLPFLTNSYGLHDDYWCTLPRHSVSHVWSILILFVIVSILAVALLLLFFAAFGTLLYYRVRIISRLIQSIGVYIIISFICWLPRFFIRVLHTVNDDPSDVVLIQATIPLYVQGMSYALFYLYDVVIFQESNSYLSPHIGGDRASELLIPTEDRVESKMRISDLLHILDASGSAERSGGLTNSHSAGAQTSDYYEL